MVVSNSVVFLMTNSSRLASAFWKSHSLVLIPRHSRQTDAPVKQVSCSLKGSNVYTCECDGRYSSRLCSKVKIVICASLGAKSRRSSSTSFSKMNFLNVDRRPSPCSRVDESAEQRNNAGRNKIFVTKGSSLASL